MNATATPAEPRPESRDEAPAKGGVRPVHDQPYPSGDSPKPHGDRMRLAVEEAARRNDTK